MSVPLSPHRFGAQEPALDGCTPAPMHQNHPQSKTDSPFQWLFHQLRSYNVSAIPLLDLYNIESECQTYIHKLKLESENTRKDCLHTVEMLQETLDELHNTIQQFERLSFGSDHSGPMSILGSMTCPQSGCFFRCDKLNDLQEHTKKGLHCRLQLQYFVLTHDIAIEAVSPPKAASSETETFQRVTSEQVDIPMNSSPVPNNLDPSEVSLGPQNVVESVKELQNDAGQPRASHHDSNSRPFHPHDTQFNQKDRLSKNAARFKCSLCSKSFTRSYTLGEHIRAHSGDRPFGCNACSKRFTRQKDRNRHQDLHSGDKRFLCQGISDTGKKLGCHRRFAREAGLISHLRSESAFKCLEPLLDIFAMDIISFMSKDDSDRQYCCHPPSGCGLRFQHLKHLKTHFDSEAGKTCIKSRLITFALPYFDHKRVTDKPRDTETIRSTSPEEARKILTTETSNIPHLSSNTCEISPILTHMHSQISDSHMLTIDTPRAFGTAQSIFAPREFAMNPFSGTGIIEWQQTKEQEVSQNMRADRYMASDASFGPSEVVEETRNIRLNIEGYTPTRGIEGDIMQVEVRSSVPLRCAIFNIQIGWFVEPTPRLQNMNAILASVEAEWIAPTSFYRYTISATVPHPWNQPRLSPVPIVLEINGLRKYGGKMHELLAVGDFTYEEAYDTAEMDK